MFEFSKKESVLVTIIFFVFVLFLLFYIGTPEKDEFGDWLGFGERMKIFINYFK